MLTYNQQYQIISRINTRDGQSVKTDCPFCGGKHTLSITKDNGKLMWFCFRASCGAKGVKGVERNILEIKRVLSIDNAISDKHSDGAPVPDVLVSIDNHQHCMDYIKRNHCYESYINGLSTIKFAPIENRIMFGINSGSSYAGRSLGAIKPKWKSYGKTGDLFTCGKGKIAVLVEDAPSACAVGILEDYTGVAILGTNLTARHKEQLSRYDKILICLDPDAARKAIKLSNEIRNSSIRLIPDDLKYYGPSEIINILEG